MKLVGGVLLVISIASLVVQRVFAAVTPVWADVLLIGLSALCLQGTSLLVKDTDSCRVKSP